jgi:hypothetical protein
MKTLLILLLIPVVLYGKEFKEEPKISCSNLMMRRYRVVKLMNEYEYCKANKSVSCKVPLKDKLELIQREARKITEYVSRNPKCNEAASMMSEK